MSCKIFCQFLFTNQLNFLYQNMLKICVSIMPASFFPILIHTLIIYIIMDDILKSTTLEDEIQQNGLKKKIIIYYSF